MNILNGHTFTTHKLQVHASPNVIPILNNIVYVSTCTLYVHTYMFHVASIVYFMINCGGGSWLWLWLSSSSAYYSCNFFTSYDDITLLCSILLCLYSRNSSWVRTWDSQHSQLNFDHFTFYRTDRCNLCLLARERGRKINCQNRNVNSDLYTLHHKYPLLSIPIRK